MSIKPNKTHLKWMSEGFVVVFFLLSASAKNSACLSYSDIAIVFLKVKKICGLNDKWNHTLHCSLLTATRKWRVQTTCVTEVHCRCQTSIKVEDVNTGDLNGDQLKRVLKELK